MKMPCFDISILLSSYKRVFNIAPILDRLIAQDFTGTFEVILWNNNYNTQSELNTIYEEYRNRLSLKLIQSSENYFGAIRLAASSLVRSPLVVICDDDIYPEANYLTRLKGAYAQYGPDAAICCQGHVFNQHTLSLDNPVSAWKTNEYIDFKSNKDEDTLVHYLHANSCLIPRELFFQARRYDFTAYEDALIDDYWISFVLSHYLKIPLWKIKSDDILQVTPSAHDEAVALHDQKDFIDQTDQFYFYHMKQNWPSWP